ncbi:PQQ-binding-like beta-propeller repeat protein [Halospeciosus flavus]|uniref:PQQ-binding-like beta-propeller repeat protein n=1 Tax=Halospeciosus flavus TaxID=3032283 RepID=A0ABD5Z2V6_9EURY|nr:PQQ-binding-like beta-propeller repeat protein [Halospeciosus flavus]
MPRTRRALLTALSSGLAASAGCIGADGGTTPAATTTTSQTTSTQTTTPAKPGEPRWTLETGTEPAALVVRDGRIYFGSDAVYALDPDGTERWRYTSDRRVQSLVVDDRVYATTGYFASPSGNDFALHALDDGNELWSFARDGTGMLSAPAVGSERVFVATHDDYLQSDGETLYGLSTGGDRLWSTPVGDPELTVAGETLFASYPQNFVAFDPDGAERWSKSVEGIYVEFVGVRGDLAFASWRGTLHALGLSDGAERWSKSVSGATLVGDTLYAVTGDGTVLALDSATGEVQWEQSVPTVASPVVADGRVYVGGKTLTALDADDGAVVWSHEFEREPHDTAANSAVFAAWVEGALHVFDAANGDTRWTFDPTVDTDHPHARGLALGRGAVYLALGTGTLYALVA